MSSPNRAKITVNKQVMGKAPLWLELPYGEHHISASQWNHHLAEKNMILPDVISKDSVSNQAFLFLECKKLSYGEFLAKGRFLLMGGIEYDSDDFWPCLTIAYIKKYGGFLKLYHYNQSYGLSHYSKTSIDGIIAGPMIHVYGPVCFEVGAGYQTKELGGHHKKVRTIILGPTIMLRNIAISLNYCMIQHEKYKQGIDLSIGWAF